MSAHETTQRVENASVPVRVKARDFISNTLQQMWEDMQTDQEYWPDAYDLTHLGKIVDAQKEMARIEAMPETRNG